MMRPINKQQSGFTIIELMIATLVFSVILLVITAGVVAFTNQYYKGVTSSNTQATARAVMDAITQDIQFGSNVTSSATNSDDPVGNKPGNFCAGGHEYTYLTGHELISSGTPIASGKQQSHNVLVQSYGCSTAPANGFPAGATANRLDTSAHELVGQHMRLAVLRVVPVTGVGLVNNVLWQVTVRVASGDDDLLCTPTHAGTCKGTQKMSALDFTSDELTCKNGSGSQFCSVAQLQTTVEKRL